MQKQFLLSFLAFAALEVVRCANSNSEPKAIKYFIANAKGLDYKVSGHKDDYRFGVELTENKQHHHTITADDGVRLGCYGHEQEGREYMTHYVADGKGYRLVDPDETITVFPNDGSEPRKASFGNSFNDETIKNGDLKYVFPNGCESPFIEIEILKIAKKDDVILPPPRTSARSSTATTPSLRTVETPEVTTVTRSVSTIANSSPEPTAATTTEPTTEESNDFCASKCCDEDRAQIILPVSDYNGCCMNLSKILIPIDSKLLSRCTVSEIVEITNEPDKVELLKKLLKFVIKYEF